MGYAGGSSGLLLWDAEVAIEGMAVGSTKEIYVYGLETEQLKKSLTHIAEIKKGKVDGMNVEYGE